MGKMRTIKLDCNWNPQEFNERAPTAYDYLAQTIEFGRVKPLIGRTFSASSLIKTAGILTNQRNGTFDWTFLLLKSSQIPIPPAAESRV